MTSKAKIGYVGVGLMGLPMAKRLLALGYSVRAYDISPNSMAAAREAGASAASSAADAARGADLVLINLPTPEAVEAAVFGENGVASALRPPQLLIDFSTIKVTQCKAFARRLRELTGAGWIDAPVSGGPPASGSGTLTVMAGGEAALVRAAEGAEDEASGRDASSLTSADVLIGVAASGTTPYTIGCVRAARTAGALTIAIANSPVIA